MTIGHTHEFEYRRAPNAWICACGEFVFDEAKQIADWAAIVEAVGKWVDRELPPASTLTPIAQTDA